MLAVVPSGHPMTRNVELSSSQCAAPGSVSISLLLTEADPCRHTLLGPVTTWVSLLHDISSAATKASAAARKTVTAQLSVPT